MGEPFSLGSVLVEEGGLKFGVSLVGCQSHGAQSGESNPATIPGGSSPRPYLGCATRNVATEGRGSEDGGDCR